MRRLFIEMLIVMLFSSLALVLGVIFSVTNKRRDKEEAMMEGLTNKVKEIDNNPSARSRT
jgi:hypothetical protein